MRLLIAIPAARAAILLLLAGRRSDRGGTARAPSAPCWPRSCSAWSCSSRWSAQPRGVPLRRASPCGTGSTLAGFHAELALQARSAVDELRAADHRCRLADPHLLDRLHGRTTRTGASSSRYLNLFIAAMLLLVLADNYLLLYVGWEGVGLASYLLIGFWYHKPSAAIAAKKAFVVNRVGDFGLSVAIMLMFATFGTFTFEEVFAAVGRADSTTRHPDRPDAAAGRLRQVRPVPAAVLAAGRDGGPDPGVGADPRGDHGHRGRLPDRALATRSSTCPPTALTGGGRGRHDHDADGRRSSAAPRTTSRSAWRAPR